MVIHESAHLTFLLGTRSPVSSVPAPKIEISIQKIEDAQGQVSPYADHGSWVWTDLVESICERHKLCGERGRRWRPFPWKPIVEAFLNHT